MGGSGCFETENKQGNPISMDSDTDEPSENIKTTNTGEGQHQHTDVAIHDDFEKTIKEGKLSNSFAGPNICSKGDNRTNNGARC